jgi:hypothetical protein
MPSMSHVTIMHNHQYQARYGGDQLLKVAWHLLSQRQCFACCHSLWSGSWWVPEAQSESFWVHKDPRLLAQIGPSCARTYYHSVRLHESAARRTVVYWLHGMSVFWFPWVENHGKCNGGWDRRTCNDGPSPWGKEEFSWYFMTFSSGLGMWGGSTGEVSIIFHGENLIYHLNWSSYLAMALLMEFFRERGPSLGWKPKIMIWQRRRWCIVSFIESSLLGNLESGCCLWRWLALQLQGIVHYGRIFIYLFFFVFCTCVYVMSFNILLVPVLGVIGIYSVLILIIL